MLIPRTQIMNGNQLNQTQSTQSPESPKRKRDEQILENFNCPNCGKLLYPRIVKKPGPNRGRPFFCCEDACNFFKWADITLGTPKKQVLNFVFFICLFVLLRRKQIFSSHKKYIL